MVSPAHFVALAVILFVIGAVGVLVRRNAMVIFMCIELMLNAVNLAFVAFAWMHGNAGRPGHRLLRDGGRSRGSRGGAGDPDGDLPYPQVRVGGRREPAQILTKG